MAGRIVKDVGAAITAATATGYITVGSVAGFYAKARANISNTGQASRECIITEVVVASNQLGIRFVDDLGAGPRYGRDGVAAYNGGRIDQPEQLIYNPNDKPLD